MQSVSVSASVVLARSPLTQKLTNGSVFEHLHKTEIRKAKDEGVMTQSQLETIVHPNEYFKRSYLLKNLGKETDAKMEG
jgi:hypothetical protein